MTNPPLISLNNGVQMPCIGIGPGIPKYSIPHNNWLITRVYRHFIGVPKLEHDYVNAVSNAICSGFTMLDFSATYGDGTLIKRGFHKSGKDREQLFIITRISNAAQKEHSVRDCLMGQLEGLGLDYVDMLMFHWPVTSLYTDTWVEMLKLYEEGYCRSLGVANCHPHHLETLRKVSDVIPAVNQIEVHPLFTQKELLKYCNDLGIVVQAYTPIARNDDRLMRLPALWAIANKYGKTPVQVVLRWHLQVGTVPIIRSLNKERQTEDISIFDFRLTPQEIETIDKFNINSRLRYDPDNCDFSIL